MILGSMSCCNLARKYSNKSVRKYNQLNTSFQYVETDSARIYLRTLGTGHETIVLIHGFGPLPGLQWLVGMGLTEFSVGSVLIPEIKKIVREVTYTDAQTVAEEVFRMARTQDVLTFLRDRTNEVLPGAVS